MGFLDPNSWASAFDTSAEDAQNKAIEQQASASDKALKLQQEQFDYQKSLQDPFFKGSLPSYYNLVDAISGQRQPYADPNYIKVVNGPNAGKYQGLNGEIVDTPPMLQSQAFNPTETDAYKWQQQQMDKNTGRTLRSLGRSNSTYG
jgi:hypothetical protein